MVPFRTAACVVAGVVSFAACKRTQPLPTWEEKEPADAELAVFEADEPPPSDGPPGPALADARAPGGGALGDPSPDEASPGPAAPPAEPAQAGPDATPDAPAFPPPLFSRVDESCGGAPGVGERVKPFTLESPAGKPISPASLRGRVVLLNFWGTWCKPCLKELPEFSRLYRRYREHGLTLVAVATDEDGQAVDQFIKSRKIAAKVAIGGEAAAGEYGARTFPFSFVIDEKGIIRAAYDGYKPNCLGKLEADIREQLRKLGG